MSLRSPAWDDTLSLEKRDEDTEITYKQYDKYACSCHSTSCKSHSKKTLATFLQGTNGLKKCRRPSCRVQKVSRKTSAHLLQGAKTFSQNSGTPLAGCKNLLAKRRHTSCRVQKASRKTSAHLLQGAKSFSQNVGDPLAGCKNLLAKRRHTSYRVQEEIWKFTNGILYNKPISFS
jgi:hypothetical protein